MGRLKPLVDALKDSGDSLATHGRRMVDLPGNHKTKLDDVRHKTNDTDRAGAERADGDAGGGSGGTGGNPRHEWGTRFFSEGHLKYYTGDGATLGPDGGTVFLMPTEDAAGIRNGIDVAIESGLAPDVTNAVLRGDRIFGAHIPVGHLEQRLPTAADAAEWPHFLEGGHTAVIIDGIELPNSTREFVVDGGTPLRDGTIIFELLDGGNIDIIGIVGGSR